MNGVIISVLLNKFNNGTFLSDKELTELNKGLIDIVDFLRGQSLTPLVFYYRNEQEEIERMIENRKG